MVNGDRQEHMLREYGTPDGTADGDVACRRRGITHCGPAGITRTCLAPLCGSRQRADDGLDPLEEVCGMVRVQFQGHG
jgi:hypothetical protein